MRLTASCSVTGWTREKVEKAFKAQKEQQVNLVRTIPVLLVYSTAVTKEDGRNYFFGDIYGFDKQLAKLTAMPIRRKADIFFVSPNLDALW